MIVQGRLLIDAHEPPAPGWLRVEGRRIAAVEEGSPPALAAAGDAECVICPGFIDAHIHLPQIDAVGCDGMELLDWLREIVFPAECRWADGRFARDQLAVAYRRMLRAGTLGFAGYLTSHAHGMGCVLDQTRRVPLRCIVGQMLMDRSGPPGLLSQPVQPVRPVDHDRITVSANPRFAVACSDHMLRLAADLAGEIAPIQTHLAESVRECEIVAQLFRIDPHYAGVYDRHRLLGDRTLLAHCVHLSTDEWKLIAQRRSVVVHCPSANTFLQSGVFDLRAAREHEVRLALGSDVAAGPDLAMPRVARAMIEVAKMRGMTIDSDAHVPTPEDAWEMITRGNADALGWPDAGRLEVGAAADLLVLRPPVDLDEHFIGRLIYNWSDDFIEHRIVDGKLIDPDRTGG